MSETSTVSYKTCTPESMGWVLVSKSERGTVWEMPDGQLYVHPAGKPLLLLKIVAAWTPE